MPRLTETAAVRPAPDLAFLNPLLEWIQAKGLQTPASFLLEMHRPLMPMAYPAAVMAGAVVAPFFGGPDYYEKIAALRDPGALDWILSRLSGAPEAHASGLRPHHPEDRATVAKGADR